MQWEHAVGTEAFVSIATNPACETLIRSSPGTKCSYQEDSQWEQHMVHTHKDT